MNRYQEAVQSLRVLTLVAIALVLSACEGLNPVAHAETVEQRAFASYGTYVVFKEQAAELVKSGVLSRDTVIKIGQANQSATPIAESLLEAALEFKEIQKEYQEGGEDAETRYIAAVNNLNAWITQAAPLVGNLVAAVQGARE